jgi:hypothetical protein
MNATLQNRINAYALAAGSFLALNQGASGQVVYFDVDPDIILDAGGETAEIDMDSNGTIDFWFHNNSFTFYSDWFSSTQTIQDILVGPEIAGNSIGGNSVYISAPYGGYLRYYAYALAENNMIGSSQQWHDADLDVMALRTFYHSGEDTMFCLQCYWYNYFTPETIDHYVAVKFKGGDANFHYGWIRCDVKDEGRTLIIKDYAYELEPEYPILAGDTAHFVEISEIENALNAEVYSFNSNIHINLDESGTIQLLISDLNGKVIIKKHLNNKTSVISMNEFQPAIYIVTLIKDNKYFHKKVFIN